MYIFSRSTIATLGRQFDAIPAAVGVAQKVTEVTGHEVNVFVARFGAPQGSVMWSARTESMAELQGITDKSMTDASAFGVKTAEYIGKSLGTMSAFTKSAYGGFNDVSWIVAFNSEADVDAFDDWQMTDSGYHDIVSEAAGLFVETSGYTTLIERIS